MRVLLGGIFGTALAVAITLTFKTGVVASFLIGVGLGGLGSILGMIAEDR